MAIRLRKTFLARLLVTRWGRIALVTAALVVVACVSTFTYFYVRLANLTDEKLRNGFSNMSVVYAAPRPVLVGEPARAEEIAEYLRRCEYSESNRSRAGWFKVRPDGIEVNPGPDAYEQEGAVIKISGGRVTEIISLTDHTDRPEYLLEPELVTNLFDRKREKRRIVRFGDIPKVVVDAVLSAEDKRFFQHPGVDPLGVIRSVFVDVKDRRYAQGSSTLTMQLARTCCLSTEKSWNRKFRELLITLHLEQKFTKKQIFEYYANSIYLGNQGSFSINGLGEGAQVYFGKDLSQVTLPEAAMLAGRIQNDLWDPFRHPEQAKSRRNLVLKNMRENGQITPGEYETATATPLKVTTHGNTQASEAPYFVDLLKEQLLDKFQDRDFQNDSYRIYTTLDMNLQHDAEEAVRIGIKETDDAWLRRNKKYGTDEFPRAQVAMIVLDAETGELKALVGGRDYGISQLDHALAKRGPGSSFKPFVYTAAMETALDNNDGKPVLTPASTVVDEPTTFWFEQQPPWTPADFDDFKFAPVTLREALAHSMNVPAVKVAELVGFDKVAALARKVGLNADIKPTPSIALGTYEVQPIEIARAYTIFPSGGQLLDTDFIKNIRDRQNATIFAAIPKRTQTIDPRVTYLVLSMMEEVIHTGTGASVAGRGLTLPGCGEVLYSCVAGKTGTDKADGWFAGFTSKLICVVWVGFDDHRDFKLEGAHSALPIWAEFMKLAHRHPEYRDVRPFEAPDGIVTVDIDADTGELATPRCPHIRSEVFIAGTQPVTTCRLHGDGRTTQVAGWEPLQNQSSGDVRPVADARVGDPGASRVIPVSPAPPAQSEPKKKGFWQRLGEIFK